MRVNFQKENIINLSVRLEMGDPLYQKCEYADLTINLDKWYFSAHTDIGDFSYRWAVELSHDFLDYLIRLKNDKEYLLSKIANKTEFSLSDTKNILFDCYEDEMDQDQKEWIKNVRAYSGQEFLAEMKNSGLFKDWRYLWELPQYDYPQNAKNFVELFSTVIVDALIQYKKSLNTKKEIEQEEEKDL